MTTTVFWFSATGNSLMAARGVQTLLGSCDLVAMAGATGREALGSQRVGLVFPLYYLGLPALVARFVDRLVLPPGVPVFAVITRGSPGMGGAVGALGPRLKARSGVLVSSVYLDMPNNEVALFSVAGDRANQKKLAASESKLKRFVRRLVGRRPPQAFEPLGFLHDLRQGAYRRRIQGSHRAFYSHDGCTGCGVCRAVCPLGRIALESGRPVWSPGCQECQACIHHCPAKAIQYRGGRTEKKRRYRHPSISWRDIAQQQGKHETMAWTSQNTAVVLVEFR